jgi:hypothetical protein
MLVTYMNDVQFDLFWSVKYVFSLVFVVENSETDPKSNVTPFIYCIYEYCISKFET